MTVAAEATSFRQYLHIEDAARSVLLALALPPTHQFAYNITGGSYLSESELATLVAALLPGLEIKHGPVAWNEGHLGPLVLTAAERDLGYSPTVNIRDGIADLLRHIRALRHA